MTSVEHSPLTRKLSAFVALSKVELAVLERLHQRRRTFAAGRDLVHQGQSDQAAYILSSGWVCSYKIQPDGTRQIVDFQVPGDFLGLRSVLLRTSDHSFEPIVDEKGAKVGDALRGGISWRCSDAVNSLPRKGYATCQRLPLRRCLIHPGFPRTR
jgi:CRP-like cAMP-binding protein